jgi:hypothetical protein
MDKVTIVVSFLTLGFVIKNWWNQKRQLQKIPIYFNDKKLRFEITRKDITRAEMQGILGIIRKDMKKSYHIDYLNDFKYIDDIYKIQRYESDELVIKITDLELKQFKEDIYEND